MEIDEIGYLTVRGQSIESAERSLQVQLRPYYKNVQVSISAPKLHTIQVLVTGAAYDPGSYSIPAVTTAFNLLTAAGGPMEDGSLRDVEVRRRGKVVSKLDLYRLILGDAQINDIQLQSGDMLVVPPRKSRVSINGEVLKPAIYELVSGETLKEALNFAGGVRRSGLSQSVRINTVTPGSERIIKDVSLNDATPLYDGDEVEVFSVRNRLTNRVTIEGAVDLPNDYAMKPGMRISDLIDRAHGPLSEAFLQQAELHRWQPDNTDMLITFDLEKAMAHDPKSDLELQKWDRIRVYNREEVAYIGLRRVEIAGAVKMPGIYDASRKMRVSDLLRMAGGPLPDAELESAHLLHFHAGAPYTHEYVSLQNSSLSKPESDPEILDNDRLIVFHVDEAKFTPPFRVEIRGEVVTPGIYPRTSGMRLSDLLAYAGGLKPSSGNSIEIAHARRLEDGNNTRVVSVSLEPNRLPSSQNDQLLEDGDVVSIKGIGGFQPEVRSFIVIGAVNKPGTVFISRNGMRLSDAIREAGGLRTDAYATGAEFYRDPKSLVTTGQHIMVEQLEMLNQLLNDSVIKQEIAKSQLDLIRAAGAAAVDATGGISGTSATQNPGAVSAIGKIDPAQLVAPARKFNGAQLDPNGYVAINLPLALQKPQGKDDIILLDGDIISVPKTPTTVQVLGAVYSKRGVLFEKGRRLEYYIDQAGGYTVDAAREKIEIFRVNGAVVSGRKSKDLEPGDVIVVPTKALSARLSSRGNTLGDLFKAITSSAILYRLSTGIFGL